MSFKVTTKIGLITVFTAALLHSAKLWANPSLGLPDLPFPIGNPQTAEKIALGKRLFHDPRFSADGTVSCASCHQDSKAFTDGLPKAVGINAQIGKRNTPTILNAVFYETLFVDGRADSLENQASGPLLNPAEHGLKNVDSLIAIVQADKSYAESFDNVFAVTTDDISINHATKAIAAYERTLIAGNSQFDRYLFASDNSALSASAQRGLVVFQDKGNCVTCHEISWNNALFTDNRFYNIGVGFKALEPTLPQMLPLLQDGKNLDELTLTDGQRSELGQFNVTKQPGDLGKFRTPTLRNIALTAPYMHDGSMNTLEEVVEHYDKGGEPNQFTDRNIFPLHLTQQEKQDLVAFMQALTSQTLPK